MRHANSLYKIQKENIYLLYREVLVSPRPPSGGPHRTRKNMDMDAEKLANAQRVLGARSETEAVDMALDYVLFQADVFGALDRLAAAGGLVDAFGSPARSPRSRRRVAEP